MLGSVTVAAVEVYRGLMWLAIGTSVFWLDSEIIRDYRSYILPYPHGSNVADENRTTDDDEFIYGIWWVPDGNGGWRDARLSECAAEIKRLRAELATTRQRASPAS